MARLSVFAAILALVAVAVAECDRTKNLPLDCYALGEALPAGYSLQLWDLASMKKSGYDALWAKGVCPTTDEMRNNKFSGLTLDVHFGVLGKEVYKLFTDSSVADLFSDGFASAPLTFRKRFYAKDDANGHSGINWWTLKSGESLPMKIYTSGAVETSGQSLKIDYSVEGNNALTEKPLLDEIRRIPNSNVYLGKMYFRVPLAKQVFVLWFALQKV